MVHACPLSMSLGEGWNPPSGACGVSKHALLHCVKPFSSPPVCCFLSDLAGQRQPLPNSREALREGGMCHGKGSSPVETKHLKTLYDF